MVTYFNRKDLSGFGRYLLSEERTNRIKKLHRPEDPYPIEERLKEVYHADVENWIESVKKKDED